MNKQPGLILIILFCTLHQQFFAQWKTIYYPEYKNIPALNSCSFFTSKTGIAVGSDILSHGGIILKTDDYGDNWDTVYRSTNIKILDDVCIVNSSIAFVTGYNDSIGYILKSGDYGNSWDSVKFNNPLYKVCFTSKNIGYAAGKNGILFKTTNCGST